MLAYDVRELDPNWQVPNQIENKYIQAMVGSILGFYDTSTTNSIPRSRDVSMITLSGFGFLSLNLTEYVVSLSLSGNTGCNDATVSPFLSQSNCMDPGIVC